MIVYIWLAILSIVAIYLFAVTNTIMNSQKILNEQMLNVFKALDYDAKLLKKLESGIKKKETKKKDSDK